MVPRRRSYRPAAADINNTVLNGAQAVAQQNLICGVDETNRVVTTEHRRHS